jgi:hypothetical protein
MRARPTYPYHTGKPGYYGPAPNQKKTISSYDGSSSNAFYVCEWRFYDVFSFYRKAYAKSFNMFINNVHCGPMAQQLVCKTVY